MVYFEAAGRAQWYWALRRAILAAVGSTSSLCAYSALLRLGKMVREVTLTKAASRRRILYGRSLS